MFQFILLAGCFGCLVCILYWLRKACSSTPGSRRGSMKLKVEIKLPEDSYAKFRPKRRRSSVRNSQSDLGNLFEDTALDNNHNFGKNKQPSDVRLRKNKSNPLLAIRDKDKTDTGSYSNGSARKYSEGFSRQLSTGSSSKKFSQDYSSTYKPVRRASAPVVSYTPARRLSGSHEPSISEREEKYKNFTDRRLKEYGFNQ